MKSKDTNHKSAKDTKKKRKLRAEPDNHKPNINSFYFDASQFEKLLLEAFITLLHAYQIEHPDETLYAFGIRSHIEFESLYPIILTEEGLDRKVREQLDWHAEKYHGLSEKNVREILRYENYDHDFLEISDDLRNLMAKMIGSFDGMLISAKPLVSEDEWQILKQTQEDLFRDACIRALQRLRSHRVLGDEITRQDVFLVLRYDVNNRFYNEQLNPPHVLERLRRESAHAKRYGHFLGGQAYDHEADV